MNLRLNCIRLLLSVAMRVRCENFIIFNLVFITEIKLFHSRQKI